MKISNNQLGQAGSTQLNKNIQKQKIVPGVIKGYEISTKKGVEPSLNSMLQREKSLNDALSIAQLSHSLINEAITISAKLKSLASQAINTGKIDTVELTNTISAVKDTINQQGGYISNPPVEMSPDIDLIKQIPFQELENTAIGISNNESTDFNKLSSIDQNLGILKESANQRVLDAAEGLAALGTRYSDLNTVQASEMNEKTTSTLAANREKALESQGNLLSQRVQVLL